MRVLLVALELGYPLDFWPTRKQSIGIGYLAAVLAQEGHDVLIAEERFEGRRRVLETLRDEEFDAVGFAYTGLESTCCYRDATTLAEAFDNPVTRAIRLTKSLHPRTSIIAGGYSASSWDEELLRLTPADFVCRGEAETSLPELLDALAGRRSLERVSGLSWRGSSAICRTPVLLPNLASLPLPVRLAQGTEEWLTVNTSRGCHARCTFCSTFSFYGEPSGNWWRPRSAVSVVDELALLAARGYRNFHFADDNFIGTDPGRAASIAEGISRRGIDCTFRFDARSTSVQLELFAKLRDAGLKRVYLGCESGSDTDLRLFHKGTTARQNVEAVLQLRSLGIEVNVGIIMFHPLSTLRTLEENLSLLAELEEAPSLFQLASELYVFRGTPIHRQLLSEGTIKGPLTTYRIRDPAAQWVREHFLQHVRQEELHPPTGDLPAFRVGDAHRDKVYGPRADLLSLMKKLIANARTFSALTAIRGT